MIIKKAVDSDGTHAVVKTLKDKEIVLNIFNFLKIYAQHNSDYRNCIRRYISEKICHGDLFPAVRKTVFKGVFRRLDWEKQGLNVGEYNKPKICKWYCPIQWKKEIEMINEYGNMGSMKVGLRMNIWRTKVKCNSFECK